VNSSTVVALVPDDDGVSMLRLPSFQLGSEPSLERSALGLLEGFADFATPRL
jgi:hypothetical protein